ncbi:MAG TPA: lipoyl synthase [Candidatus Binatia bacterium]|jgi:lipoic acid synthetase|nr:lipoyl synthase [Candidatus Binatia bacterium]
MSAPVARRHPEWLKVRAPGGPGFVETRETVRTLGLHTVCEEARCPNIGECWGHKTATFMLLGDTCTRRCAFCAVGHGRPRPVDPAEPIRVASAVARLGLRHVVVTSVDRDDLPDGGAAHFAATARAIKGLLPACRVEVLVPDFQGDEAAVTTVAEAPIDVFNHNVETVPRLYRRVRSGSRYDRSLAVLAAARAARPGLLTKTGLMLGLGEEAAELRRVFADLRSVGCAILTLGQYLRPSGDARHVPVERYLAPEEFAALRADALALGFLHVESGPLVRSSYHAWAHVPS